MYLVRPFTINRLADIIRLSKVSQGIKTEDVEDAMMVTKDRALELLKQAWEMKLIRLDGNMYYSSNLGNVFFEAFHNEDNSRIDEVLGEYLPYLKVKHLLSERSANMTEIKVQTGLTEVAVEIVLRLLDYVNDDLCCANERFYIRSKELPEINRFLLAIRKVYDELREGEQWGCGREFIRVDKVASQVCTELRLSTNDFAIIFDQAIEHFHIEIHSEVASYQFIPFSPKRTPMMRERTSKSMIVPWR